MARVAYLSLRYAAKRAENLPIQLLAAAQVHAEASVRVEFNNGDTGDFPFAWLRDNSPDAATYHKTELCKARLLKLRNFDLNVKPQKVNFNSSALTISWPDGVRSTYDAKWLAQRNLSNATVRIARKDARLDSVTTWNAEKFSTLSRKFDFQKMFVDDYHCHDALCHLLQYGLVIFENARKQTGELRRFAGLVGYNYASHYGKELPIRFVSNPSNLAYTNEMLEVHSDLPYMENPPDVQLMHSIARRGLKHDEGLSVLTDGFYVSEVVERERPDLHKLLRTIPIEFVDEGVHVDRPFDMNARHTVLGYNGETLSRVIFNNHMRSWFLDVEPKLIPKIYEALQFFLNTAQRDDVALKLPLEPGEVAAFANNRVLHGRTSFSVSGSVNRHLEAMHFTFDAIKSKVRHLKDLHGLPGNQISV